MKISKLFHYLYAFLMLMPVFAVGVKCAYVVLNQNANDNYVGSYNYLSNVELFSQVVGKSTSYTNTLGDTYYKYHNINLTSFTGRNVNTNSTGCMAINTSYIVGPNNQVYEGDYILVYGRGGGNYNFMSIYNGTFDNSYGFITSGEISKLTSNGITLNGVFNTYGWGFTQDFYFVNRDNYIYFRNEVTSSTTILKNITCDSYFIDTSLSAVFYSAIDELDNVSFFSWARHSFIAEPFLYIGNLFGIPDVHPIFTFLSYWCAISIIYLVFDLFMYVPLLAHRWIDKGMIE